jgi:hypothetical protein
MSLGGNERAVSTHTPFKINEVVGLADGPNTLGDPLTLGTDALECLARRVRFAFGLLQASRFR